MLEMFAQRAMEQQFVVGIDASVHAEDVLIVIHGAHRVVHRSSRCGPRRAGAKTCTTPLALRLWRDTQTAGGDVRFSAT